jgi:hypothetical protein
MVTNDTKVVMVSRGKPSSLYPCSVKNAARMVGIKAELIAEELNRRPVFVTHNWYITLIE